RSCRGPQRNRPRARGEGGRTIPMKDSLFSRRTFVQTVAAGAATHAIYAASRDHLREFDYARVTLTGGPLKDQYDWSTFHAVKAEELFPTPAKTMLFGDVAADGSRFLINTPVEPEEQRITFIAN